jgi:hypothetical protein
VKLLAEQQELLQTFDALLGERRANGPRCCERDHDGDGACDRHPVARSAR